LTILFVHIDDGYQEKVQPWRSGRAGRKPKLSVSEMMTLMLAAYIRAHQRHVPQAADTKSVQSLLAQFVSSNGKEVSPLAAGLGHGAKQRLSAGYRTAAGAGLSTQQKAQSFSQQRQLWLQSQCTILVINR